MIVLLLTMLERLGIIVTVALVITRFRFFRNLINQRKISWKQQLVAMVFFGFFGIIGTYTGLTFNTSSHQFNPWFTQINHNEAIANSRVIGIVMAGLLGGYKVGIGAGLIAGLQRYSLGGFTAFACSLSSVIAGILAGFIKNRIKDHPLKFPLVFLAGSLAEFVQMSVILMISKPFPDALSLVQTIGLPMIISNGIGSLLFWLIIRNVLSEEEKAGAVQAQKALRLANLTIPYLRKGLNVNSAQKVCEILSQEVEASAIAMTDKEIILAHVGLGDDHHKSNIPIQTDLTKRVLKDGELMSATHEDIHCKYINCPLSMVVVAPLKSRGETVGTLKFYFQSTKKISHINLELIQGLGPLLSSQLEIAEVERAYHLATELEIKALQAQISPHFLFNSLNTIVSLIRIDQSKARKLLISLSKFFRQNLAGTNKLKHSLEEELNHVRAYLEIEETRFVDRLSINYEVDRTLISVMIPPLTLQPIVENSIKHGLKEKETDCQLLIRVFRYDESWVQVEVHDNGVGMKSERLQSLGKEIMDSEKGTGFGLYNVNRRLEMMFGDKAGLKFDSKWGEGTIISFRLPIDHEVE